MIQKQTLVYANHGMPLECDIYTEKDYPTDTPVFLFFHSGGLVAGGRDSVPPWLVQVCLQRKWPLISPTYRLLPQTGADGLLEDVTAAYAFALKWDAAPGTKRRVIVGGASGGFFPACLVAHHLEPKPAALFSIQGINTFRHAFFNSSTLLTPKPITDEEVADIIAGPVDTDATPIASAFRVEKLLADGSKNPAYTPPEQAADQKLPHPTKGMLYDYYTYTNGWTKLVGGIDPGYEWARGPAADRERLAKWPPTVIFHGNSDYDVELAVSEDMRNCLGDDKVYLAIAEGQPHLYEQLNFIEDEAPGMDAVRKAVARLDEIVA